jgi:hypothetical protein
VTAEGSPLTRFSRALKTQNVFLAEVALGEMEKVPLDAALKLVNLYGEAGDPKYEPAARKWLARYIAEEQPSLKDLAATPCSFVEAR